MVLAAAPMKIATLQGVLSARFKAATLQCREEDIGSQLHCCILLFVPTVRAVLPLCRRICLFWSKNPLLADRPIVGRVCRKCGKTLRGSVFSPLWGRQAERLAVCLTRSSTQSGRKSGGSPNPLLHQNRRFYARQSKTEYHPDHPADPG